MRADWTVFGAVLDPSDSVVVLKRPLTTDDEIVLPGNITLRGRSIPAGHKMAIRAVPQGGPILKYGQYIGRATQAIHPGDHVHAHNLEAGDLPTCHSSEPALPSPRPDPTRQTPPRQFDGFQRPSGKVGTRNYLAVISSVNCSASVSRYIADAFRGEELRRNFPNVDGVIAFTHKTGCAMDPGEPTQLLQRVLAGIARHPNIGGYLLIGLGCEVNQVSALIANEGLEAGHPGNARVFNIQFAGGVRRTVEAGIEAAGRLLPAVNASLRTRQPASALVMALNCGGSDGHSGCTANPALGVASDLLVAAGGTSVLAETPEIYGAEHLLAQRAIDSKVRDQLLAHVRWWENHVRLHGTTIDNNPSFGNRQGGLTTIYEKSLGAIAKGGHAPLSAVYRYADAIAPGAGFCFMDTPGYDPVSMTGLIAGGCNIAVFTTGRGSAYGCKPTPCIKVASNSLLYQRQKDDMDLNAGTILDGTQSVEEVGRQLYEDILAVASGRKTQSELCGLGDEEFAPWMLGPTL